MGISKGWIAQTLLIVFLSCFTTLTFATIYYRGQPTDLETGIIWIGTFEEKEDYNEVSTSLCGHCGSDFVGTFKTLKHLNFTEFKWYRVTKWQNLILYAEEL